MPRLTAILFLAILVFNFCGYRLVLSGLQAGADNAIQTKVDRQTYRQSELISLKTTLHLPYYTGSAEFSRAYGSININGTDYEYVMRRVYNDTLEVLCLPNTAKTKLTSAGTEMAKATADGQASAPGKKSGGTLKISLPDYCQAVNAMAITAVGETLLHHFPTATKHAAAGYTTQQERPPQGLPA